ncbi:hypothetical protein [Nostoc sp. FACHB-110]|uniref:hypothetical protein n=1 Tax=Nostoc sp. FACHB-110 TaxID=2692834 RepID=UPI0016821761|nr:hypothetical protein [Nostoc sp. FACHB-110]MBD2437816.1 hypothetical protein [Nostoc sp. FACHB-110]
MLVETDGDRNVKSPLEKEVLEGEELRSQLLKVQAPATMHEWLRTGISPPNTLLKPANFNGKQNL